MEQPMSLLESPLHCTNCVPSEFVDTVISVSGDLTEDQQMKLQANKCGFCQLARAEHLSDGSKLSFLIGERLAATKPD
jgi:hypothetical protein